MPMNCQKCKCWKEMYERAENEKRAAEQALREILISHGQNGDGGNLDKFTRRKCLEVLQASDRRSNNQAQRPALGGKDKRE